MGQGWLQQPDDGSLQNNHELRVIFSQAVQIGDRYGLCLNDHRLCPPCHAQGPTADVAGKALIDEDDDSFKARLVSQGGDIEYAVGKGLAIAAKGRVGILVKMILKICSIY